MSRSLAPPGPGETDKGIIRIGLQERQTEMSAPLLRAFSEFVVNQKVGTLITTNPHSSRTEFTQNRISEDERSLFRLFEELFAVLGC